MDYRTLFIFDIVSLAVYSGALLVLAFRNRRMPGMSWLAASLALLLVKAVLQSMHGILPAWLTVLLANQIIVLSFFAMYMGFRHFVLPNPMPRSRAWLLFGGTVGFYVLLCLTRPNHPFIISSPPGFLLCVLTVWLLLRHGKDSFLAPARAAAAVLFLQIGLGIYRTVLIIFFYDRGAKLRYASDPRWLFSMFAIMFLEASMVLLYVWFFVVESHRELRESALTDALTGVMNRRAIDRESKREISRARRSRRALSLIAIDVDFFKSINDRYGHHAGDQALCALADLLRSELRQIDLIARLGGEEFALLLPDTDLEGAIILAEKLRRTLHANPLFLPAGSIAMTFTAGVSQLLSADTGFNSLMERADKALYRGKAEGRNRIMVAEPHRLHDPDISLLASAITGHESSNFLVH